MKLSDILCWFCLAMFVVAVADMCLTLFALVLLDWKMFSKGVMVLFAVLLVLWLVFMWFAAADKKENL